MSTLSGPRQNARTVVVTSPLGRLVQLLGLGDAEVLVRLADDVRGTTALLSGPDEARDTTPGDALAALERAVTEQADAAERVAELAGRVERRLAHLSDGTPPPRAAGAAERLAAAEAGLDRLMRETEPAATQRGDPGVEAVGPESVEAGAEPTQTAEALMHLVDRVGTAATGRENPDPLIGWLHRRLVDVLAGEGVTLIDEQGPFDPARHEVVDTRTAERADQADCICATVRPGFCSGERVLRPQQVILWQWEG